MHDELPLFHNAITLEMAKELVRAGGQVVLGRQHDYMSDQRCHMAVVDADGQNPRYVIEPKESLEIRRLRLTEVVEVLVECGVADVPLRFPLCEDTDFKARK